MAKTYVEVKISGGTKGIGGRNESWFSTERDASGNWWRVHEWNNLDYNGRIDKGEDREPLDRAECEQAYAAEVAAAEAAAK